ncbi:DHH family phosphoesterase [Hydrogenothermus marinus]|uniref:Phosphoesterase RecJ-like protein n=1 Tax=Hydrogenothermus marinus TaxID=133270 RepID=A0A3M0BMK3_9AQUI|nr:bifunctional oligoribonuclease/PAP phosphatase NrnA [Hydrogenothermus marinus]RMA96058.1 phosphoesterase RecJ-like protein [Hydrogenothermus marinus]
MKALIDRIKREKGKILIFTHENPDADGIGSMLALYEFLKNEGKDVECAMKDPAPAILDFLPNIDKIKKLPNEKTYDLAILVDAAGAFRAGTKINAKEIIRIDHHIGGNKESNYDFIDTYAPSTTFLVAKILRYWNEEKINSNIATNLYTGLLTDTGSFRYNNVDDEAFEMAEFLVKKGADPTYIANMIYERNKLSTIKLLQLTLSTLKLYAEGKIASLIVERKYLHETGALEEETEGFVNYARSIDGVEIAFIMIQKEDPDLWRVSIRGKGNIDVREIAEYFGGGGHRDAAGCRIRGKKEEVLNKLVERAKQQLEKELNISYSTI